MISVKPVDHRVPPSIGMDNGAGAGAGSGGPAKAEEERPAAAAAVAMTGEDGVPSSRASPPLPPGEGVGRPKEAPSEGATGIGECLRTEFGRVGGVTQGCVGSID